MYNFAMKKIIEQGFTNKNKYVENGIITIEKEHNGFNHRFDYKILNELDFVPEVVEDNEKFFSSKFIEGQSLSNPTDEDLKNLGLLMRKLHMSDIKLPGNNIRRRVKEYIKKINDKYLKVEEIDQNWDEAHKVLKRMGRLNPVHNDVWNQNIVKDKDNKLWLVDWEYASMGDKHFDLAYYIESAYLDERQEAILLEAYDSTDDYKAFIDEWMPSYKLLVNWLALLWAYSLETLPFPQDKIKSRLNELKKELDK